MTSPKGPIHFGAFEVTKQVRLASPPPLQSPPPKSGPMRLLMRKGIYKKN